MVHQIFYKMEFIVGKIYSLFNQKRVILSHIDQSEYSFIFKFENSKATFAINKFQCTEDGIKVELSEPCFLVHEVWAYTWYNDFICFEPLMAFENIDNAKIALKDAPVRNETEWDSFTWQGKIIAKQTLRLISSYSNFR